MPQLGQHATKNGDLVSVSYGHPDTQHTKTWDSSSTQGCLCDDGYHGYDCSFRDCPSGDDPRTMGQHNERQIVHCRLPVQLSLESSVIQQANSPKSINFQYRRHAIDVPVGSSIDEFQELFNAAGLLKVKISYFNLTRLELCSEEEIDSFLLANGHNADTAVPICLPQAIPYADIGLSVDFISDSGDVPAIRASYDSVVLGGIDIYTDGLFGSLKGTTENEPCSGRGICSAVNGRCDCFQGFRSSDGIGGPGPLMDCGYQESLF